MLIQWFSWEKGKKFDDFEKIYAKEKKMVPPEITPFPELGGNP